MKKFYSVKEAADLLDLSTNTIYKYIKEGKLDSRRIGQGRIKIPYSTLEPHIPKRPETSSQESEDVLQASSKTKRETSEVPEGFTTQTDNEENGNFQDIDSSKKDRVFLRIFKGLFLLGLGAIYIASNYSVFEVTLVPDDGLSLEILATLLPYALLFVGLLTLVEVFYPKFAERSQGFLHILGATTLFYYAIFSLLSANFGAFVFGASLALVVINHLIRGFKNDTERLGIRDDFLRYGVFLTLIGGIVVVLYPELFPIPYFSEFIIQEKGFFAMVWFILLLPVAIYLLSETGRESKIASLYFGLTGVFAILIASYSSLSSSWDVSYVSYLTGIFALFLAWWVVSSTKVVKRKVYFLAFSFLWIGVTLLLGIYALQISHQELKRKAFSQMDASLDEIVSKTNLLFEQQSGVMVSFATKEETKAVVTKGDRGAGIELARQIYERLDSPARVIIYNQEGIAVGVYPRNTLAEGTNFSSRDYFQKTKSTYKPYISPVFESIVGTKTVMQTEPIFENNVLVGVIGTALSLEGLDSQIRTILGEDYSMQVVDKNGKLVVDTGEGVIGTEVSEEKIIKEDTDEFLQVVSSISKPGWSLYITANTSELIGTTSYSNMIITLLLIINALFSLGIGTMAASGKKKGTQQSVPMGVSISRAV